MPYVDRPVDITVHGENCHFCSLVLEGLEGELGPAITNKGVRWLQGDLGCLTVSGFRWALPSYLNAVISGDEDLELGEYLVYYFTVEGVSEEEIKHRENCINILNSKQIMCVISVLKYVSFEQEESFGSNALSKDIERAIDMLRHHMKNLS